MAPNIGVNVIEVDGRAAPTIVGAPISVTAFLLKSRRGPVHKAIPLRGLSDFSRNFGGVTSGAFGAHAVRGFFENGGTEAWAVRIASGAAVSARATLNDSNGTGTLRVTAGVRGEEDPGSWANDLRIAVEDHPRASAPVPAQIKGAQAEPFAGLAGQSLSVSVNGGSVPVVVAFLASDFADAAAATADEVAAAINSRTSAVRAAISPAREIVLSSGIPGNASQLVVGSTPGATALGFTGPATTLWELTGVDSLVLPGAAGLLVGSAARIETRAHVVGDSAVPATQVLTAGTNDTIVVTLGGVAQPSVTFVAADFAGGLGAATRGELVAAINSRAQGRGYSAALTADNRLVIVADAYGPLGSATPIDATGSAAAALGLGTNTIKKNGARVFRAITSLSGPGPVVRWSGGLTVQPNVARLESVEFDLVVQTADGTELERWDSLTMEDGLDHYAEAVVNDESGGSGYVFVEDRSSGSGVGADVPAPTGTSPVRLGSGVAGNDGGDPADADYIGDPTNRSGLYALDTVRFQLLGVPETTSPGVVLAALGYCERRGEAMFVGSPPRGLDLEGMKAYASTLRGRKVFGALYGPWIRTVNPTASPSAQPTILVPPVGHILGMYARVGDARGVWKAPAGDEAFLASALGVEYDMTDADHTDLVKNGSVNGVRAIPGAGVIVDASRTLSTDSRWLFANVRRLMNFVKGSLKDGLRFVVQEPHSEELRRMVRFNVVSPFLLGLWRQGAFGSDPADDVFTIKCDAENNPPAEVNLGNFRLEVYFYPVKPAETIVIVVGQQEDLATAGES